MSFLTIREAAAEISAAGRRGLFVQADLSRKDEIDAAVSQVLAAFGRINILVNNAGIHLTNQFLDVSEADYDRLLSTNLKGPFFCGQAAARHMVGAGGGSIVNISSVSAEIADPGSSATAFRKAASRC